MIAGRGGIAGAVHLVQDDHLVAKLRKRLQERRHLPVLQTARRGKPLLEARAARTVHDEEAFGARCVGGARTQRPQERSSRGRSGTGEEGSTQHSLALSFMMLALLDHEVRVARDERGRM